MNMLIGNGLSTFVQLFIGLCLFLSVSNSLKKLALWISIPWVIVVWRFGEAFGNLFTGSASFYTGAPGSVLLYGILALFLLFPKKLSLSFLPKVVGVLFLLGVMLNEFPMFWKKGMQSMLYQMSQSDTFSVIAAPAKFLSQIGITTSLSNGIAIGILAMLGILLLIKLNRVDNNCLPFSCLVGFSRFWRHLHVSVWHDNGSKFSSSSCSISFTTFC